MSMLRVAGILALVAVAIGVAFAATHVPGFGWQNGRALGETIGGVIAIFSLSMIGAGIARMVAHRSRYGPLTTGLVITVLAGAANLSSGYLPVGGSVKEEIRSGFMASCMEKARSQGALQAAGIADAAILNYCTCVHDDTAADITAMELTEFARTQAYPQRVMSKLPGAIASCGAMHLSASAN